MTLITKALTEQLLTNGRAQCAAMDHMNIIKSRCRCRVWLIAAILGALAAGCGQDRILGVTGIAALVPAVIAESPPNGASGMLTGTAFITASRHRQLEEFDPATSGGS